MSSQTNQKMYKKTAPATTAAANSGSPPPFQQRPLYPLSRNQGLALHNPSVKITLPNNQLYSIPEKADYFYDKCYNPIEEICRVTDNLEQLSPNFRYSMLDLICKEDASSTYGEYAAPACPATVEKINGSGGHFLKLTVEAASIYLIWYNRPKNIYMFWGPTEQKVRDAMNRIRGRIVKYTIHLKPHQQAQQHHQQERQHQQAQQQSVRPSRLIDDLAASPPPPPTKEEEEDDDKMPPLMKHNNYNIPPSGMQRSISCAYEPEPDQEEEQPPGLQRSFSIM